MTTDGYSGESRASRDGAGGDGPRFRLEICKDDGTKEYVNVTDIPITVGRSEDATVVIPEARVSRHHCVFFTRAGRLNLQDQGSSNGTLLNERRIERAHLRQGDEVSVGSVLIHVEVLGLSGVYGVTKHPTPTVKTPADQIAKKPDAQWSTGSAGGTLQRLAQLNTVLASSSTVEAAAQVVVQFLVQSMGLDRAFLLLKQGSASTASMAVAAQAKRAGVTFTHPLPFKSVTYDVLVTGNPVHSADVVSDPRMGYASRGELAEVGSLLCAPLHEGEDVAGVLYGETLRGGIPLTHEMVSVFSIVSGQAALAVAKMEASGRADLLIRERAQLESTRQNIEKTLREKAAASEEQQFELAVRDNELHHLRQSRLEMAQRTLVDTRDLVGRVVSTIKRVKKLPDLGQHGERNLEEALFAMGRLVAIAEDSLAVVQMEEGEVGLSSGPLPLGEALDLASERNSPTAKALGVSLKTQNVDEELTAVGDVRLVERLLDTLIACAFQSGTRGGEVTLSAISVEGGVEIRVIDTSRGSDLPARDPRDSASRSTSVAPTREGTGLYLCRLAAEAHGGSIRADVFRGRGRWVLGLPERKDDDTVNETIK